MIWKSKAKEKQTVGMRSRRKPVKPGDRGQLSQIHITKRSYKSSRGGVSVDPEKINPSLTIQGHQHGTHGGPAWLTTTSNKDKIYIHHSRADTVRLTWRNTICPYRFAFTHVFKHTHTHSHKKTFTHSPSHIGERMFALGFQSMRYPDPTACSWDLSHNKRLTRHYFCLVYRG